MVHIRQPIISVLAHVDHGKTSLLDYIRGSSVAAKEAGGITQHIGATEIPISQIQKLCKAQMEKLNIDLKFPGLLFIDTPGHAAFSLLRKRGGTLADIAILVVDITEGFKPQTEEAITILKQYKTPFIVAANKVDKLSGWKISKDSGFHDSYGRQRPEVKEAMDMGVYKLIGQFYEKGFSAERFDRVDDFTKQISIIPISAINGEGISDLLTILSGVTQKFLEKKLEIDPKGEGKGTILEVKEVKGLGMTIDVILYDGIVRAGDTLVIGDSAGARVTKAKALLKTNPMKEIRVEKQFRSYKEVVAASGVKISASGLEGLIAGVPVRAIHDLSTLDATKIEVNKEIESIEIETDNEGVIVKTDAIGSLEAMVKVLSDLDVPIKKAKIGSILRKDIMELKAVDEKYRIVFAFNVDIMPEAEKEAKDNGTKIFRSDVIYRLLEDYEEYQKYIEEQKKQEVLKGVIRPGHIRQVPGYIFRQSKPAIAGFDIVAGVLAEGVAVMKRDGTIIGRVNQIKENGKNVKQCRIGSRVAVSIDNAIIGRSFKEGDELFTVITKKDNRLLKRNLDLLSDNEKNAHETIRDIMTKKDRLWDIG
ncbi:MAG: translation initiation factor IF-2 [Nanohaloarchaea archaeon]|nr:translation initiation factor IF-2 [Candidatus Nanohaloarchaea archaeon]